MKNYLAIDIGGTKIKYSIIKEDKSIDEIKDVLTEASKGGFYLLEKVKSMVEGILCETELTGIGISSAGVIDNETGRVLYASENIPNWTGIELKKELEEKFNIPVFVENDVNAYALGENWIGDYKEHENMFCITLGTGIGGGIIINNSLYRGGNKRAGEIGYILRDKENKTYENRGSTKALVENIKSNLGYELNGIEIFDLVKKEDVVVCNIFNSWIDDIIDGIIDTAYILDPNIIIIGGGVSNQGKYLEDKLLDALNKKTQKRFNLNIKISTLKEKGNLYGAVYPFFHKR